MTVYHAALVVVTVFDVAIIALFACLPMVGKGKNNPKHYW